MNNEQKLLTKKCPHCLTDIPVNATKCPQCHTDLRSWIARHPVLTFFILIIMVPIFLSVMNEDSTKQETTTEPVMSAEELATWQSSPAGKLCAKHTDWSMKECSGTVDNKVWVGMKYEMLVYQSGKPDTVNPSNYGSGIQYQYCWDDLTPSCYYDDNNDGVIDSYN